MPAKTDENGSLAPPARLPRWALRVMASAYGFTVQRRNARFDRGARAVRSAGVPVISVGSITAGGAGKSPMTRWIAGVLLDAGVAPAIALRGYRRRRNGESDEAVEHAEALPDTPIAVGADRLASLQRLREAGARFECAILDDGFQRRDVRRDLDIALVDATREVFADALLPLGLLREPPASLRRADAIIITRADRIEHEQLARLEARLRDLAPDAIHATAAHVWTGARVWRSGAEEQVEPGWLVGRRVVICCALARPEAFEAQAREAGADLAEMIALRDHADFSRRVMRGLEQALRRTHADVVLCAEKDWVKLRRAPGMARLEAIVARPALSIAFLSGEIAVREAVVQAVRNRAPAPPSPDPSDAKAVGLSA